MSFFDRIKNKRLSFKFDFFTKKKILIFSSKNNVENFDFIKNKFTNKVFFLLHNEFNFFIFMLALLKLFYFNEKSLYFRYLFIYIKLKKIKILISDRDNYPGFYLIKKKLKKIKVILFQNGTRSYFGDVFYTLKKKDTYKVDDFIVFAQNIKKKYAEYVKGNYHVYGSYRLNNFLSYNKQKENKTQRDTIVYISQYREALHKRKILPDNKIVRFLDKFCKKNKINFKINLTNKFNDLDFLKELNHYKKILNCEDDKFFINKNPYESYKNVLSSSLIVACDSTMGYEVLSLGRKIFFISIRRGENREGSIFGWPSNYKNEGFFWSNYFSEKEIEIKLNTLLKCNNSEWLGKIKKYKKKIAFQDFYFSKKVNGIIGKHLQNV